MTKAEEQDLYNECNIAKIHFNTHNKYKYRILKYFLRQKQIHINVSTTVVVQSNLFRCFICIHLSQRLISQGLKNSVKHLIMCLLARKKFIKTDWSGRFACHRPVTEKNRKKQQQQQKNNMQAIDVPKSPQFYIVTTNFFSKEMFLSNQWQNFWMLICYDHEFSTDFGF